MKLGKYTPANVHEIRKPMWNGRKVGIANYKIGQHNLIKILAKDKDGRYIYSTDNGESPATYYASGEQLNNAETMKLPKVTLQVIPIGELDLFEGRTET